MAGYKVQAHFYAHAVGLAYKPLKVFVCSIAWSYAVVVCDVVAAVVEFTGKDGAHPYCVESGFLYVRQAAPYAFKVSRAVTVTVLEGGRVNVVDDRAVKPGYLFLFGEIQPGNAYEVPVFVVELTGEGKGITGGLCDERDG